MTGAAEVPAPPSRLGPLHARHEAAGAKSADFGGWRMPLEFAGGGVLKEHAAVRGAVGLFDVSHLGKLTVRGPGALGLVQSSLTADLDRIGPGQAQYTLCCDEVTGGVVDDLIVYRRPDDDLLLVPNAANAAEVGRRLAAAAPAGVEVRDAHAELAVLAVQGPRAAEALVAAGLPRDAVDGLGYMSFADLELAGRPVVVCRTGYTGERGFELLPRWDDAGPVWDALLGAVRGLGGLPAGLGARDTLRTEMGYPLHGADLSPSITPVQARLGWAVGWSKPSFWGADALRAERATGPARLLRGLLALDRGIPRPHMRVLAAGGDVGEVTSGTFSPTRRAGIGLALLDAGVAEGDEVEVDVRGRRSSVRVVKPPFVDASPSRAQVAAPGTGVGTEGTSI